MNNKVVVTLVVGDEPDLIDAMSNMSRAEFFALRTLRDRLDRAVPQILISQVAFSVYQKAMFKSGVNGLITRGIVRRERRSHYMLDPNVILYTELYDERLALWYAIE